MLCKALKLSIIILLIPFVAKGFSFNTEKIDINTATLEQLETLTGVGPVYAQRIIDARPFSSVDDLLKVSGIGEKTLQKIKDQGLAHVETLEETILEEAPKISETLETIPPDVPDVSYPKGVIISKLMPSPEGADTDNEYIELKNTNNFEVDLSSWILRDKQGSIKEYILEEKIPASGILNLLRPKTKIILNNSGDGIEFLNPLKETVDFVDFGKSTVGIAYIRTSSGWQWDIQKPTEARPLQVEEKITEAGPLQASMKEGVEINLANESKKSNISIYLIAVLVAFISSIIFLILKRKLFQVEFFQ